MPRDLACALLSRRRPTTPIASIVTILAWLLSQATPAALISYAWTFDELRSKSDLVVIAERTETHDTGEQTELTEVSPPFPVIELNTSFKVLTVLKGRRPRPVVVLRHYRKDTTRMPGAVLNGPLALNFSDEQTTVYLLFLKREADGRYSPTSGQVVPGDAVVGLPKNPLTIFPR